MAGLLGQSTFNESATRTDLPRHTGNAHEHIPTAPPPQHPLVPVRGPPLTIALRDTLVRIPAASGVSDGSEPVFRDSLGAVSAAGAGGVLRAAPCATTLRTPNDHDPADKARQVTANYLHTVSKM